MDEDWALEARDEHAHKLGEALEHAATAADEPSEALRLTRAQVALDPLAEAPNRRLIERLAAGGDRAAALSAGRQFAERLRTQLGIAPSGETRALLDALRRDEPASVPPPPSLGRAQVMAFVGRQAELDRMRASWAGVQMHSERRIVLVAGEPGIGKTRLAHQFASAALAGDLAYVGDHNGKLYAIDTKSGKLAWEFQTEASKKDPLKVLNPDGSLNQEALFHCC